jgi:hypothetical protein
LATEVADAVCPIWVFIEIGHERRDWPERLRTITKGTIFLPTRRVLDANLVLRARERST